MAPIKKGWSRSVMSRPLGKIFTNNTVFTSEGFCLIYFSTRPKLPVLCAIFYISPTECKWLCWGKKKQQALRVLVQILALISAKLSCLSESSLRSGDGNLATDEGRLFSRWNKTAAHAQTWRHERALKVGQRETEDTARPGSELRWDSTAEHIRDAF